MSSNPRRSPRPERDAAASAGVVIALGGMILVCGAVLWMMRRHSVTVLLLPVALGGGFMAYGGWLRGFLSAQALLQTAVSAVQRGRLEEAESLLTELDVRSNNSLVRHAIAMQRAVCAVSRGDLSSADRAVDTGLSLPTSRVWPLHVAGARAQLRAMKAFLSAAHGDEASAREAARSVIDDAAAQPEALAYAALCDVLCARRAGRDAVRTSIALRRVLLLEYLPPPARALVRTLWRAARLGGSPYRSMPAAEARRDATLLHAVLPDMPIGEDTSETVVPIAQPATVASSGASPRHVVGTRSMLAGYWFRVLLVWFVLVCAFLAVWQLLASVGHGPRSPSGGDDGLLGFWVALVVFAVAFIAVPTSRMLSTAGHARLLEAARWLVEGQTERAVTALTALTSRSNNAVALSAFAVLAKIDERAGRFSSALQVSDRALARLQRVSPRGSARAILRGPLTACRALCFAALDRPDDARRELEQMRRDRTYHHELARYRVELMLAVRRGDFAAGAELDAARPVDLPVPYRDELLGEIATAIARGATTEQLRRLGTEIAEMSDVSTWLHAVAPGALASLSNAAAAV